MNKDSIINPVIIKTGLRKLLGASAVDQWHRIVHKVNSKDLEDNIVTILVDGIKN